jgi:cytochrome b6-f complex iron-sulfur subunit
MNRRDLVQKIALGGAVILFVPSVLQSCTKDTGPVANPNPGGGNITPTFITLDLTSAENSALNNTGGSRVVQGIIVANTGSGNFVALASACTHAGTTVGYNSAQNSFICPNHGSKFSTTGSVLLGPATTALQSHAVSKSGNILTITV